MKIKHCEFQDVSFKAGPSWREVIGAGDAGSVEHGGAGPGERLPYHPHTNQGIILKNKLSFTRRSTE